jgi:hypothetical protein
MRYTVTGLIGCPKPVAEQPVHGYLTGRYRVNPCLTVLSCGNPPWPPFAKGGIGKTAGGS